MRLLATAALLTFAVPSVSTETKPEAKAQETALELLRLLKNKDLDALAKLTSVPFAYKDGKERKVLKDEAAVKAWIKEHLDKAKDPSLLPTTLHKLVPFAEVKVNITDADDRKLLEEIVGKDGFVAIVGDAKSPNGVFFIRMTKDGEAKAVGAGR